MHIFDNAFTLCQSFELLKKIFVDIHVILSIFKWFKNVLYMLRSNLGQNYLHFVVLFCACWSILGTLCQSFPIPPLSPSLHLSMSFPLSVATLFQAAWKSC